MAAFTDGTFWTDSARWTDSVGAAGPAPLVRDIIPAAAAIRNLGDLLGMMQTWSLADPDEATCMQAIGMAETELNDHLRTQWLEKSVVLRSGVASPRPLPGSPVSPPPSPPPPSPPPPLPPPPPPPVPEALVVPFDPNDLIQGSSYRWPSVTITYGFPEIGHSWGVESNSDSFGDYQAGWAPLHAQGRAACRAVMAHLNTLGFDLVEVSPDNDPEITFGFSPLVDARNANGVAGYPTTAGEGNVWFRPDSSPEMGNPALYWGAGGRRYLTALHEILHALGLRHSTVTAATRHNTVMAVSPPIENTGGEPYPTIPFVADRAALKLLYPELTGITAGWRLPVATPPAAEPAPPVSPPVGGLALPPDVRSVRRIYAKGSRHPLRAMDMDNLERLRAWDATGGPVSSYAVHGGILKFWPAPPDGTEFLVWYYGDVDGLSEHNPLNAILARHPHIYFCGAMRWLEEFLQHTERATQWGQAFYAMMDKLQTQDRIDRTGPAPLVGRYGAH